MPKVRSLNYGHDRRRASESLTCRLRSRAAPFCNLGGVVEVRLDRRRRPAETVSDLPDREALELAVMPRQRDAATLDNPIGSSGGPVPVTASHAISVDWRFLLARQPSHIQEKERRPVRRPALPNLEADTYADDRSRGEAVALRWPPRVIQMSPMRSFEPRWATMRKRSSAPGCVHAVRVSTSVARGVSKTRRGRCVGAVGTPMRAGPGQHRVASSCPSGPTRPSARGPDRPRRTGRCRSLGCSRSCRLPACP